MGSTHVGRLVPDRRLHRRLCSRRRYLEERQRVGQRHESSLHRPAQRDDLLLQHVRLQRRRPLAVDAEATSAIPRTVPSVPRSLTATAGNAGQRSWVAPASNGGSPILGYSVLYAPSGGSWQRVSFSRTSYTITGLVVGTTYYFRISAYSAVGGSPSTTSVPSEAVHRTFPSAFRSFRWRPPGDPQLVRAPNQRRRIDHPVRHPALDQSVERLVVPSAPRFLPHQDRSLPRA